MATEILPPDIDDGWRLTHLGRLLGHAMRRQQQDHEQPHRRDPPRHRGDIDDGRRAVTAQHPLGYAVGRNGRIGATRANGYSGVFGSCGRLHHGLQPPGLGGRGAGTGQGGPGGVLSLPVRGEAGGSMRRRAGAGIAEWLAERGEHKVALLFPQRGHRVGRLALANDNAKHAFSEKRRASDDVNERLAQLKERLLLPTVPRRIECCDISHLG